MSDSKNLEEFKKLAADESGTVYVDRFEDNVRVLILRGPASLCAYLGIPIDHPLAGNSYDDLPISCNGGLTFARAGAVDTDWPEGYYWYGWDYGHCDDMSFYGLDGIIPGSIRSNREGKPWTVKDVEGEIWNAVYDLKKLMRIAERAANKK